MRIAIDAMGADNSPFPEVGGACASLASDGFDIILVGDEEKIRPMLAKRGNPPRISVVHASEIIGMDEQPVVAVRKKKDASMLVAMRLVKTGQADAMVSAGNTGAVMVAARNILRPIEGVSRSAICQQLPTMKGRSLVLDLGANVDCTARHLCDFAEMGVAYVRQILGIEEPRVGLLNIGEEQAKGNELAKTVHKVLSAAPHLNFVGNIEPKAFYQGATDVLVCDGFAGNLLLKTSEGAGHLIRTLLTREIMANPLSMLGGLLSRGAFKRLRRTVDPNEYTGAELLGVNGVVIILHGSCTAKGVANGIKGARLALTKEVNKYILLGIRELRKAEDQIAQKESNP
ncbi:MAG: phosphate acyltransferase [Candidatus Hydrogenedentota bacterium]